MVDAYLSSLLAFAASVASVKVLETPARRMGLVDVPGGRKKHVGSVALIGGLVTFVGVLVALMLVRTSMDYHGVLMAGCLLLLVTGILDDRFELSPLAKVAPQMVAALLMAAAAGNQLLSVGDLFGNGPVLVEALAPLFTVFAVIGVINALNMADGLDGLAGGLALIGFAGFAWVAGSLGLDSHYKLLLLFAGAVVGFLVFNMRHPWRRRARIFLGDSGSMVLGFVLAWHAVEMSQGNVRNMSPVTALWILALPLMDAVSVMFRRLFKGRNPFCGGRDHLHHVLLHAGFSHATTVWILLAIAAALATFGIAGWAIGLPEHLMFGAFLGLFGLYHFWAVRHAWKLSRWLRGTHRQADADAAVEQHSRA